MRKVIFGLRPADAITIIFLLFLSGLTILFYENIPRASILITIYVLLICLQIITIKFKDRSSFLGFFHNVVFPTICVLAIFDSLGSLVHYINPEDVDSTLIRLDYLIFQGYPTIMLEKIMSPLLTDILQLAYSTYYFIPLVFGVALLLDSQRKEFDKTLFLILLCFYLSYLGYILIPAIGPRFTINHLQANELQGLFIAGPIQKLLDRLEGIKRDAFPSGHTAIALVVLYLAYRFKRKLFRIFSPVVLALIFSTVYCRYHYVVDVIGGFGLAVLSILLGEAIYDRWLEEQQRSRSFHILDE